MSLGAGIAKAAGIPTIGIVVIYSIASMEGAWPINSTASAGLFAWGLACCGGAGYLASRAGLKLFVGMAIACGVSVIHFAYRNWLITASHNSAFLGSPMMTLAVYAIAYTLPLTLLAAWIGFRLGRRAVHNDI
ncbi:hypothetical protein BWI17_03855 [Betaproteobacteria bacterium GR16-43]|nr:hypothetical protein BWI17_03855 [Betaproteobacteria bacterium GR16-43]